MFGKVEVIDCGINVFFGIFRATIVCRSRAIVGRPRLIVTLSMSFLQNLGTTSV